MAKRANGNGAVRRPEVRCAIYTRKSSEEGLEQEFNSLDAQREACEAYIRSQRSEGWVCLPALYDDGGISGATLERAALKRLLAEIEAGAVDAVVVYKVDRLTRSLADFAKIVEVFDARGVSFVSVTQQFNTTTSMGRLTLNMLLSFAQFEREVTGERIRDKIAASKRRGLWMGGLPPLGYDVRDRKLVVNEAEAASVLHIFERYAELGSVLALKSELDRDSIRSKVRADRFGRRTGGKSFARGALYLMLQNRIYRGEIVHKDRSYAGEHAAVIDQRLWDTVQARLEANRVSRTLGSQAEAPSLLAGLLYDSSGERMSPTHTKNAQGTRYRYYISQGLIKGRRGSAPLGRRVPAGDLEGLVEERLRAFLKNDSEVHAAIGLESSPRGAPEAIETTELLARAAELGNRWPELPPSEKRAIFLALLQRVELMPASIEVEFLPGRLISVLLATGTEEPAKRTREHAGALGHGPGEPGQEAVDVRTIRWSIPARLKRTGIEKRLLIEGADNHSRRKPDHSLLRLLAQAQQYQAMLLRGDATTIEQLAKEAQVTGSYFTRILRLSFLAPQITRAILQNRHPLELTAKRLANEFQLPTMWEKQRALLGVV